METKFRINEVIKQAKASGKKILKKDIAKRLFPDSVEATQQVNFLKLTSGKTKRISPEWVGIICEICDCTPNELFGYKEETK